MCTTLSDIDFEPFFSSFILSNPNALAEPVSKRLRECADWDDPECVEPSRLGVFERDVTGKDTTSLLLLGVGVSPVAVGMVEEFSAWDFAMLLATGVFMETGDLDADDLVVSLKAAICNGIFL